MIHYTLGKPLKGEAETKLIPADDDKEIATIAVRVTVDPDIELIEIRQGDRLVAYVPRQLGEGTRG